MQAAPASLQYSEEDVSSIKRRAEILALLARSENVSRDQLHLLRDVTKDEQSRNAVVGPVVDAYSRFLDDAGRVHAQQLSEAKKARDAAQQQHTALQGRMAALQDLEKRQSDLEAQRKLLDDVRAQVRARGREREWGCLLE